MLRGWFWRNLQDIWSPWYSSFVPRMNQIWPIGTEIWFRTDKKCGRNRWTDARTDDAKTISLRLCRGIIIHLSSPVAVHCYTSDLSTSFKTVNILSPVSTSSPVVVYKYNFSRIQFLPCAYGVLWRSVKTQMNSRTEIYTVRHKLSITHTLCQRHCLCTIFSEEQPVCNIVLP